MGWYKLLAGQHVADDQTQKPDENGKHPQKTFSVGEVVYSDTDLVERFGREKFQETSEPKGFKKQKINTAAPGAVQGEVVADEEE